MELPTIKSYGKYSSSNYGVNSLRVRFTSGFTLYYSYETIIAFIGKNGLKIRKNDWSSTTGKHLNWINDDKKRRLDGTEFEKLLLVELSAHNLV